MSRRGEFDDGHDRARNHTGVVGGGLVKTARQRQWLLDYQAKEGGYSKGDVWGGSTLNEATASLEEGQRRDRHRWLEENG